LGGDLNVESDAVAQLLLADLGRVLARARAGYLAAVPRLELFPQPVLDGLLRMSQRTVEAFARSLQAGAVLAEDRHLLTTSTAETEQTANSAEVLLDDNEVAALARAMYRVIKDSVPDVPEIGHQWLKFLADAMEPSLVQSIDIRENDAYAALETEEADIA
jgi:hypothetical protein